MSRTPAAEPEPGPERTDPPEEAEEPGEDDGGVASSGEPGAARPPEATGPAASAGPVLRLGVSSCLMGENVRSNGGHCRDHFLVQTLGRYVEWVRVCPEAEAGMGTPREVVRLVGTPTAQRMLGTKSGTEWTERMEAFGRERAESLAADALHGFVFKRASPSCGVLRVKLYDRNGVPSLIGEGLWSRAVRARWPLLPVEEEGRLHDPRLRENFIERLFIHQRWQRLTAGTPTMGRLVEFHTAHKLSVLAHDPQGYRELGQLVAQKEPLPLAERLARYGARLMRALEVLATPGRHANVLEHLLGFLKDRLGPRDKAELLGLIHDHRAGLVPLVVPLTLLNHHLGRHEVPDWVHAQVYLHPYPRELMLRNHV